MSGYEALPNLPKGFTSIREIKEKGDIGKFVNVIGFITDWLPPSPPVGKRQDWMCKIKIKDLSTQDERFDFEFAVFTRPEEKLPAKTSIKVADVILIRQAKIQRNNGYISLLSSYSTSYFIATLPQLEFRSYSSPQPGAKTSFTYPSPDEKAYMIKANSVKEMSLPTEQEFTRKTEQANIVVGQKEKFKTLKDVKSGDFCDLIGQVVRIYGQNNNPMEMYLSDYTANSGFFDYICNDGQEDGRVDEHGYIKTKPDRDKWPGPYGKLSIAISIWEPHAEFVQSKVKVGDWVFLRNVRIEYDSKGSKLEGKLREDRNANEGKIQVSVMSDSESPESSNFSRWKEAVRRKRDWWAKYEQKRGEKRKHEGPEPLKLTSKMRRKLARAEQNKKVAESTIQVAEKLVLNENVRCGFLDIPVVPLKAILEPQQLLLPQDYRGPLSPFTNCKYRAHVRVIDYFPDQVEDFAVGRHPNDMDILSDYSGGEDTDLEDDTSHYKSGRRPVRKKWEWRFALHVVDASSKTANETMWLMVGNHAAQGLLGINEDAADLRDDPDLLEKVKEQLFYLWGDLEEQKSKLLPKNELPQSTMDCEIPASSLPQRPGTQPDLDSDDENNYSASKSAGKSQTTALSERDANKIVENGTADGSKSKAELTPNNKAFTCCIRQYGVKVEEKDPAKANAGNGQRWQRMFGLFETTIV